MDQGVGESISLVFPESWIGTASGQLTAKATACDTGKKGDSCGPKTHLAPSVGLWPAACQEPAQSQQVAELHRKQVEEFLEFLKGIEITSVSNSKQVGEIIAEGAAYPPLILD